MKILLVLNPFKGTLSSAEAGGTAASGLGKILRNASCRIIPVSDGGDGFLDCFRKEPGAKAVKLKVSGPLGGKVKAEYLLAGKTAYIEIAEACGIKYLKGKKLKPLEATSYGVGELIKDALKKGAVKIYLGLGGTAASDGGAGMAKALGFDLKDASGAEIKDSVKSLADLAEINPPPVKSRKKALFFAVTDVKNPLLGRYGSAIIYGPQKGAGKKEILLIEKALEKLSTGIKRLNGRRIRDLRGGGAAGGLGAGLYGFLGAKILDGSEFVAAKLNLKKEIEKADLVITGEGRLDDTTFSGKMPGLICRLAGARSKKIIFITGSNGLKKQKNFKNAFIIELNRHFPLKYSLAFPEKTLTKALLLNSEKIKKILRKNSKM